LEEQDHVEQYQEVQDHARDEIIIVDTIEDIGVDIIALGIEDGGIGIGGGDTLTDPGTMLLFTGVEVLY
jgi:hypothetical protein